MPLLLIILLSAAFGGIASAAFAVVFLWIPEPHGSRILPHLVSFATGALLGAALLALLPEAIEGAGVSGAYGIGLALILGLGAFFVTEKLVLWWHVRAHVEGAGNPSEGARHGHDHRGVRDSAAGVLVLVGDSLHNVLDGALIAAAFLTSHSLGVVTMFAVAAHEIPHRMGDFAILVHSGLSRPKALVLNLATGLASLLGALVSYFALRTAMGVLPYALAFAAAGFIYIALAGLVPALHGRADVRTSATQVILLALGVAVVAGAAQLAHH